MFRRALLAALLGLPALPAWAQPNDPSFRIVNRTTNVVNEVYASPISQRNWGHDRLGDEVIPPGGSHIIRLPIDGNCVYDIRIVYQDGTAEERRNVNTCNLTNVVLGGGGQQQNQAQQGNPSFNLVNQSRRMIHELFASPSSRQDWGPDRLGDDVVRPGQTYPVRLPYGECQYDIRIVFQGGDAQERRGVNTCSINNYVVR
ncbi:MAG: hypothetical protein QJR07_06020 [Acetobacteraceae bacterium]|nr:hypothetical protein [Acetobacteraceae bacterium]